MGRITLEMPDDFRFVTELEVRISDINYGNHLSNDVYLSLMHEARMRFFQSLGYSEKDLAGAAVIMGDAAIIYKKECFYGEVLQIWVTAADFGEKSFELYYRFIKKESSETACEAKTGMVCYNYEKRQTQPVPDAFKKLFVSL